MSTGATELALWWFAAREATATTTSNTTTHVYETEASARRETVTVTVTTTDGREVTGRTEIIVDDQP